jgi:hypothetical protein
MRVLMVVATPFFGDRGRHVGILDRLNRLPTRAFVSD